MKFVIALWFKSNFYISSHDRDGGIVIWNLTESDAVKESEFTVYQYGFCPADIIGQGRKCFKAYVVCILCLLSLFSLTFIWYRSFEIFCNALSVSSILDDETLIAYPSNADSQVGLRNLNWAARDSIMLLSGNLCISKLGNFLF